MSGPNDAPQTLSVLESVEAAMPLCRHVRIDLDRLSEVAAAVAPTELGLPTWDFPVFHRASPDLLASQIVLFNAINFCYWGEPKWEVSFAGEWWGGSMAMLGAISRAFTEGIPLLDARYLSEMSFADLAHVLRGRGELQLMDQRLTNWRQVGSALLESAAPELTQVIIAGGKDALGLVRALIDIAPSFDDVWSLGGKPVHLYKRAQLTAAMLFELFGGRGWGELARVNRLTVFADYKVPQVLRRLGILVYDSELSATVDGLQLIPAGDPREVEIRAATVWAGELLRRALADSVPDIQALHVDYWLWSAGRFQGAGISPYHRSLTTAY